MKDKLIELIEKVIKENLRVEIVEWYGDQFSIRLLWGKTLFYESRNSDGRLQ